MSKISWGFSWSCCLPWSSHMRDLMACPSSDCIMISGHCPDSAWSASVLAVDEWSAGGRSPCSRSDCSGGSLLPGFSARPPPESHSRASTHLPPTSLPGWRCPVSPDSGPSWVGLWPLLSTRTCLAGPTVRLPAASLDAPHTGRWSGQRPDGLASGTSRTSWGTRSRTLGLAESHLGISVPALPPQTRSVGWPVARTTSSWTPLNPCGWSLHEGDLPKSAGPWRSTHAGEEVSETGVRCLESQLCMVIDGKGIMWVSSLSKFTEHMTSPCGRLTCDLVACCMETWRTSSQKSNKYSFLAVRDSGILTPILAKVIVSWAVSICAPKVRNTLLDIKNGVLDWTMHTLTFHRDNGTNRASWHSTVLLFPKRKTVLHGIL